MKRVVQYSVDILIRNEEEDKTTIEWEEDIAEALEEFLGVYVVGVGFSADMTEVYKSYIEEEERYEEYNK